MYDEACARAVTTPSHINPDAFAGTVDKGPIHYYYFKTDADNWEPFICWKYGTSVKVQTEKGSKVFYRKVFEALEAAGRVISFVDFDQGDGADFTADKISVFGVAESKFTSRGNAKLTEEEVAEIRHRYDAEHLSQEGLASDYGVSQMTISNILRRETWTHI